MPRTDDITPINDDLNVVYSHWPDGTIFRRIEPLWKGLRLLDYVPPSANLTVKGLVDRGVTWNLCEHTSITVSGTVYYTYDTAIGVVEDTGTAGCHNVENGGGYLPKLAFGRLCDNGHVSCCILPKLNHTPVAHYSFEIAATADPSAAFSHEVQGLAGTFIIGRIA